MFEDDVLLLSIVSLPKEGRVRCQHPGCTKTVYRRVHIVKAGGVTTFVGSKCFKKLYGCYNLEPKYGSSEGRELSKEERDEVVNNTELFIEKLKTTSLTTNSQESALTKSVITAPVQNPPSTPMHKHLFMCLKCSDAERYTFESTERFCPNCGTSNDVFTLKKMEI